ncbi:hypothetical protein GOP47_0016247 [Adiantum capillus-veneris]|uniref:Ankyrin repeat protein n=1 Tax=Adiantum capillus-veneris TaxID=13818 RepID=A0A9D4UHR4_ADICA|nr:hypothetical protein GOP47_0016247 [Adiantum capillus-veneris]
MHHKAVLCYCEVCATTIGNKEIAEYLINNRGDVNFTDGRDVCPLLVALNDQSKEMITLLERYGATVPLSGGILLEAVEKDQLHRLELLLKAGAAVDEISSDGETALMHAVAMERLDAVKLLMSVGVSCILRDSFGCSARDLAGILRHQDILDALG